MGISLLLALPPKARRLPLRPTEGGGSSRSPSYDINRYTTHLFSDEPTTWPATECVDGKQQGGGLKRLNIFVTNGSTRDSGTSIASRHGPPILSSSPPVRLHVGHKYSTPDTPWSKLAFVADSEAVAEKALTIRHDQSFVDGNHRTATLTLFEYLWQAGYDTRDLDPLDVFLLIAPEPEKPNAAVEIGRLVRRHTRRGTMTLEAQRIGADRVKSLPIIVSALFVLAGWVGPTPLSVWGSVVLDETLTVKRKIQSPVVGAFERHQRRIKLLETSAQKEELKLLYALSRKLFHRKE
ncbi:hypothetical protein BDY24DRAFT_402419 [Mrakia frigida]|uniref:uncharacterized protein n=1 Tax=Mrakia frigida TaxID=29902 RepID=UPI003FCC15DB